MVERKHPLAECERCPWFENTESAFGVGPDQAEVAIIGEAPGKVETSTGEPFTGISGKLLDAILDGVGIKREDVYIDNACACHPPYVSGQKSVQPPRQAVSACWPRLKAELESRGVETVVSLGNTSSQWLLDTTQGITSLRVGPPRVAKRLSDDNSPSKSVRVIPTIHPAAALRSPDHFPSIVTDFKKIATPVGAEGAFFTEPRVLEFDDAQDAMIWLAQVNQVMALDIETSVEKDSDWSHPSLLLCVGLAIDDKDAFIINEELCANEDVRIALRDAIVRCGCICHNGKFDMQILARLGIIGIDQACASLAADTMFMSYIEDERPGTHGLKYLSAELLGSPAYEDEMKAWLPRKGASYAYVPRPILYKYNGWDVALTWRLYDYYMNMWQQRNPTNGVYFSQEHELLEMLMGFARTLMKVEFEGVAFDEEANAILRRQYQDEMAELEYKLAEWVINPRSPKQVKEALEMMGHNVSGTDVDILTGLLEKEVKFGRSESRTAQFTSNMLTYRKVAKLYGTYVKGLKERVVDGRIYTTFLVHGTVTGRLSSRNPNLQNIPRGRTARAQFIPSPGNTFVQADYGQAELRAVGCLARDEYLHEVLGDPGRDIHGEVAQRFFGSGYTKEQRVRAKAVVFGLVYGREAYSIAQEFDIGEAEAQSYLNDFFALIPEVAEWREWVKREVLSLRPLVSPFGRKRRFHLITKDNKRDIVKEALAFLPSSTASDICMTAAGKLGEVFENSPAAMRIFVHDSILVECPTELREGVGLLMKATMEKTAADVFDTYIPFFVDVEYGRSWGELEDV